MHARLIGLTALICSLWLSSSLKEEKPEELWKRYKESFQKRYASDNEERERYEDFIRNIAIIDDRNDAEVAQGGQPVHGLTIFSDISQDAFRKIYLAANPMMRRPDRKLATISTNVTSSSLVDWTGVYTTPVKDQGYCGSCWAFSATEQIESDAMRTLDVEYVLSPEQIVECDTVDAGCRGGWTETAYEYVKLAGGLETEVAYPYTSYHGITGQCKANRALNVVTVEQYYTLDSEDAMAAYVQSTGPLSVCVDAESWNSYTAGIMRVCGVTVDHCVQAVGVLPDEEDGYWKVRNSWGYAWGEAGFIRLAYGHNTCAIARDPTYAEVSLVKS